MKIDGETRMAAVIANPIRHSLSPFIHNLAFDLTSENGVYLAWEVQKKDLHQVLANVRSLNMYGVNLSMPYKSALMNQLDDFSEVSKIIGAANTIVNEKGRLIAHNTDGLGFFKSLESQNFTPENSTISLIGAGSAARSILVEAAFKQVKEVHVFARNPDSLLSFHDFLKRLAEKTEIQVYLHDLSKEDCLQEKLDASDLFVNATSVGMDGMSMPISEKLRGHEGLLVSDIIYKELETPFLTWACKQNLETVNGLGMLIYQAAESFKLWTGKEMPIEKIEKGLREKLYGKFDK